MTSNSRNNNNRSESYMMGEPEADNSPTGDAAAAVVDEVGTTRAVESTEELELIYGAKHVVLLFIPVTICMTFVVVTISLVKYFTKEDGEYLLYTPFHPDVDDTGGQTLLKSLLNSLIILCVVVVMTFLLIILYKLRCYKLLHGWIILSSLMLLFMFAFIYIQELLKTFNIAMDLFTIIFCLLNFGVTGMVMIHWKGPLLLQQSYLIISAALMSLVFIKYLPEWTLWLVLGVLALWDLFAVLTPHGPLKMLVETAQERGETIMPALIYSSTVMYSLVLMAQKGTTSNKKPVEPKNEALGNPEEGATEGSSELITNLSIQDGAAYNRTAVEARDGSEVSNGSAHRRGYADSAEEIADLQDNDTEQQRGQLNARASATSSTDERGVKLGLGDFIFYSVLVGKASAGGDLPTTVACFIGILMGLFLTLAILVTVKKALPALPISIFFGLLFNFGTSYVISPMVNELASKQIFI